VAVPPTCRDAATIAYTLTHEYYMHRRQQACTHHASIHRRAAARRGFARACGAR